MRFVVIALLLFFCSATLHGCDRKKQTTNPATGEPSRNPTNSSHYYDPATAGPGYPGQSVITVYLNTDDFRFSPESPAFPSRWEVCRDAVEMYRPILKECGKEIVYVDSPVGANVVLPRWTDVREGKEGWTAGAGAPDAGTIYIDFDVYNRDYTRLFRVAAHEFGHSLGIKTHSTNRNDIMYKTSLVSKLSERDKNTIRLVLRQGRGN